MAFLHQGKTAGATSTHCPLSSAWGKQSHYSIFSSPWSTGNCDEILPDPSPERRNPASSVFPPRAVLQTFDHLCRSPLDLLQFILVFIELWGPEMRTILRVWPDKCWIESNDHVSTFAWNEMNNILRTSHLKTRCYFGVKRDPSQSGLICTWQIPPVFSQ